MNYVNVIQHSYYSEIQFSREEKRNAFHAEMIAEITAAFEQESLNNKNRCLLLRGNGKCFSAGADLNYMKQMAEFSKEENIADSIQLYKLFETVYNCPVPVVCYVHGASFGGSNGILAACDYILAEEETKFCFSETRLGLLPATISPFVMNKIGEQHALDLFLTARVFQALEAKQIGLVNQVVPAERAEEQIKAYLKHFQQVAPEAVKNCKKMIRQINKAKQEDLKNYTAQLIAEARVSEEGQEGIHAFFEKRKANWNQKPNNQN